MTWICPKSRKNSYHRTVRENACFIISAHRPWTFLCKPMHWFLSSRQFVVSRSFHRRLASHETLSSYKPSNNACVKIMERLSYVIKLIHVYRRYTSSGWLQYVQNDVNRLLLCLKRLDWTVEIAQTFEMIGIYKQIIASSEKPCNVRKR